MFDKGLVEEARAHNVIRRSENEGDILQVGDMNLIWKVRGAETGYQFSSYEVVLQPGMGIPFHKHPYAEYFRILSGKVSIARLDADGNIEWLTCVAGDAIVAPPNAPHTYANRSGSEARLLSVSTYHHEMMFNLGAVPVGSADAAPPDDPGSAFATFVRAAAEMQAFVLEPQE